MAKKIKFALAMADGVKVRTLDDLRLHFDLVTVLGYYLDGKLSEWLSDRYFEEEANAIDELDRDDADLGKKLCTILAVPYEEKKADRIDIDAIEWQKQRINQLKQYMDDQEILDKVNQVAFTQAELEKLVSENAGVIYLCNNTFKIPLQAKNRKYVGIGDVEAVIVSDRWVDFESLGIVLDNVHFDEAYHLIEDVSGKYELGKKAENQGDYESAMTYYLAAAKVGHIESMNRIGWLYAHGEGAERDYSKAMEWYQKAANLGDAAAMGHIGTLYYNGNGVAQDFRKAMEWYQKAIDHGGWVIYRLALLACKCALDEVKLPFFNYIL